jgi:hypothetical protein
MSLKNWKTRAILVCKYPPPFQQNKVHIDHIQGSIFEPLPFARSGLGLSESKPSSFEGFHPHLWRTALEINRQNRSNPRKRLDTLHSYGSASRYFPNYE